MDNFVITQAGAVVSAVFMIILQSTILHLGHLADAFFTLVAAMQGADQHIRSTSSTPEPQQPLLCFPKYK